MGLAKSIDAAAAKLGVSGADYAKQGNADVPGTVLLLRYQRGKRALMRATGKPGK